MADSSGTSAPVRPWQAQLVQQLKSGRMRYMQRIAVICAALDPRPPYIPSSEPSPRDAPEAGYQFLVLYAMFNV